MSSYAKVTEQETGHTETPLKPKLVTGKNLKREIGITEEIDSEEGEDDLDSNFLNEENEETNPGSVVKIVRLIRTIDNEEDRSDRIIEVPQPEEISIDAHPTENKGRVERYKTIFIITFLDFLAIS